MVFGVIYLITNLLSGKKYVGQTKRPIKARISEHKRGSQCVDKAIQKYGWENFKIEILEECDTQEKLDAREIFWIAHFNCKHPNGYNLTDGGKGTLRFSHPPEVCAKISAKHRGKHLSDEHRIKLSVASMGNKNWLGRQHTESEKSNLSRVKRSKSPFHNLIAEIDKRQLSYHSLAKLMELSLMSVSLKMRGKYNFTAKDISKLVEIFYKPAEYLMARDDE